MVPYHLHLFVVLVVALVSRSTGSLDLLIIEDYRQIPGGLPATRCPSCTVGGDNCSVERTFALEGECENLIHGSDSFMKVRQGQNNSICLDVFSDSQCRNHTLQNCDTQHDTCVYTRLQTFNFLFLPNWCMAADEPSGDYRMPLVRQYFHAEDDPFCNGTIDATRFSLVDPNVCETSVVQEPELGTPLHGSVTIECLQNGEILEKGYLNQHCDGDFAKDYPWRIENGGCIPTARGKPLSQTDCASPKWYCKSIVGEVPGFFELSERSTSSEVSQYAGALFSSLITSILVSMVI